MKKTIYFLLLTFVNIMISQTKIDSIASKSMGEIRSYTVSVPANYENDKTKKYPLIVLLDGDYLLEPFVGAIKYSNYWDDLPEVIVIGIHQNKKNERETDCEIGSNGLPKAKGAKFFDFINMELLPTLESKFRISSLKIIAGHGITAGFANLFLYQNKPIFNGYILLSPEISEEMIDKIPDVLAILKKPLFYYQATADGDLKQTIEDVKQMQANLLATENINIISKSDEFPSASHYSLVLHAIPNALNHIFSAYKPISNAEYLEKIVVLEKDHVAYLSQKYDFIKKQYGVDMKVRFSDFKAIEAAIITKKDFNAFDDLAIMARKNYPKSMLADYFLAQQFENKAENTKALKYYMSAFQQEEIGDLTKKMMMENAEAIKSKMPNTKKSK